MCKKICLHGKEYKARGTKILNEGYPLYLPKEYYGTIKRSSKVKGCMSIPFTSGSFSEVADYYRSVLSPLEGVCCSSS